jgi:hypothetical protein
MSCSPCTSHCSLADAFPVSFKEAGISNFVAVRIVSYALNDCVPVGKGMRSSQIACSGLREALDKQWHMLSQTESMMASWVTTQYARHG